MRLFIAKKDFDVAGGKVLEGQVFLNDQNCLPRPVETIGNYYGWDRESYYDEYEAELKKVSKNE